ncbi:hypothetical protein EPA93_34930 [Ktedonosporobacter rubrisoli]|uniref:Uncharacterized protein n=1 Tax=Ktedonosporobacter rubrisoli TaxID=2509675 RepID=A0A4P6JYR6_KTERU|nr:hypothetical protein [Ktedonosporobacter rubrisoli]QBD80887.1 hypothetical protein EPA93_34930 [Ktedonosporobacter rubrisoli]
MFTKKISAHEEDAVELTAAQLTNVAGGKGKNAVQGLTDSVSGLTGGDNGGNGLLSGVTGTGNGLLSGVGNTASGLLGSLPKVSAGVNANIGGNTLGADLSL